MLCNFQQRRKTRVHFTYFKNLNRQERRTEDNIFTLQGTSALRKSKKGKTFLAFLDLSKAFDRVWREGLFYLLWKNGIQGKCWNS
jgi:hypothetical protein